MYARHCAFYLGLAERAEAEIYARGRNTPVFAVIHRERHNFDIAFSRAIATRPVEALALAVELGSYAWQAHAAEQCWRWCDRALKAVGDDASPWLRARALLIWGNSTVSFMPDPERVTEALEVFRRLGDERWIVRGLLVLSNACSLRRDFDGGRRAAEEALAIARQLGDTALIGEALGHVALSIDNVDEAFPIVVEAAALRRSTGGLSRAAGLLTTAGMAALREDAYERSEQLQRDALAAAVEAGDPNMIAMVQGNIGLATLLGGKQDAARVAFRAELTTAHAEALGWFYMEGLLGLAALAAADGEDHLAAVLDSAAWALADRPVYPSEAPVYERVTERFIAPARRRYGEDAWAAAQAEGRAMTPDAVVALAVDPALLPH